MWAYSNSICLYGFGVNRLKPEFCHGALGIWLLYYSVLSFCNLHTSSPYIYTLEPLLFNL
jgi:hypothetical protein